MIHTPISIFGIAVIFRILSVVALYNSTYPNIELKTMTDKDRKRISVRHVFYIAALVVGSAILLKIIHQSLERDFSINRIFFYAAALLALYVADLIFYYKKTRPFVHRIQNDISKDYKREFEKIFKPTAFLCMIQVAVYAQLAQGATYR